MATSKSNKKYPASAPKKKKHPKMDRKLVAAVEDHEHEVKSIASNYKIPIKVVRATMLEVGKKGKPARSRRVVYAALRKKGYTINTRYTTK